MLIKAVIAVIAQVIGMVCVIYDQVVLKVAAVESFCGSVPENQRVFGLGAMSMMLEFVIIVFSYNEFQNYRRFGAYRVHPTHLHNKPHFLNPFWISIGRFINTASMMSVLSCSALMLWLTSDPTAIIFDAIAMFFLIDMDNMFVTPENCREFELFLKEYRHDHRKPNYVIGRCFKTLNFMLHWYLTATFYVIICGTACIACFNFFCPTPLSAA